MMAPPAVWQLLLPLGLLCLCSSAASLSGGATAEGAADYVVVATSWLKIDEAGVPRAQGYVCDLSCVCPHVQTILFVIIHPLMHVLLAAVDAPANLTASSWVPLSHSYGPCSAAAGSLSPAPADVLLQDQRRAGYIQRKLAGSTPQDDNGSDLPESDCKSGQSEHAPTIGPNIGQDSSPTSEAS